MSALTPHIKVLRAEAAQLLNVSRESQADGVSAAGNEEREAALVHLTTSMVCARLSQAKFAAADQLEADETEREERVR